MGAGAVLGWLHVIVDVGPDAAEQSAAFWSAALGWDVGDPWTGHPEFRSFLPPDGDPYVHQQVGEHGPRIHVDLETRDVERETERLRDLGAEVGARSPAWHVLTSPGGLPFCLLHAGQGKRPGPRRWPTGHWSRAVQVCIDAPTEVFDREVAFWRTATGWRWEPSSSPEFAGKLYPDPSSPVQILLQRLDSPAPTTRAHLDLGAADDREAEVRRLVELGAARRDTGRGWIVLTDPTGLVFCVTGNAPD